MVKLKQSTGFKTLDKELKKDKYKGIIESFDINSDGYWLYLNGYNWDGGAHMVHERTITELIDSLQMIQPCECEKCKNGIPVWTDKSIHKRRLK